MNASHSWRGGRGTELSEKTLDPAPYMALDLGGRLNDSVALVLITLMGMVFASFGPSQYFDWSFVQQESPSREFALTIFSIPAALCCLWLALNHACRLFSSKPDALIDETGIALKSCVSRKPFGWSEIAASRVRRVNMGRAGVYWALELELEAPIRTLATCFWPSRKITMMSRYPPRIKEAGRIVRHYRPLAGWKR